MVYNNKSNAGVLELADEVDSKSIDSDIVRVQVPPPAPIKKTDTNGIRLFALYNLISSQKDL